MKRLASLPWLWQFIAVARLLDAAETPSAPKGSGDVFRHTTGYSYGDEPSVREFYERVGLRYWGPQELFPPKMTIARAAHALARVPALHHPGERFTYGFNTDLLGRLIEVWSGEPLDRYLQRALFEPLEMVDTGFSVPLEKRARFTSCHAPSEGQLAVVDRAASSPFNDGFEFLSGGGGLVSTVRDYANFGQMLVDGGQFKGRRLLQAATLRLMFTDQLRGVDGANRFGLGFAIDDVELGSGVGCCLGRLRRKAEAVTAARQALAREPSSAFRLNDWGWALLEAESYAEARATLPEAVALAPADCDLPRANLLHLEECLKQKHSSRKDPT